jgi:hypothetical protein
MDDFSVSYHRTTKIVTGLGCLLLAMPAAALHSLVFRIVAIVTLLVGLVYSPKPYTVVGTPPAVLHVIRNLRVPPERYVAQSSRPVE